MNIRTLVPASLKQNLANAFGWKTDRKIIVFESDDWGAVRMPSRKAYEILNKKGLRIGGFYNRYDSLANAQDLTALFEVLGSFKDNNGNHPIFTANCLLCNPDFDRIRAGNFERYFYESFTETLKKYPGCEQSFALWREGINSCLFMPQFHGREHLNVPAWMAALQTGDRDALLGFEYGFWGHSIRDENALRRHYLAAYDFKTPEESDYVCRAAAEGAAMFEKVFGYTSRSFIAPNFVWSSEIEKTLYARGTTIIQSQRNQLIPDVQKSGYRTKFHYSGQKNPLGQRYLVRNAYFEPSSDPSLDWVQSCLKDIERTFFWKTPVVISSHRVNFIGSIFPENRDRNLKLLKRLIDEILKNWPDVEFTTSCELGNLILK